MKIVVDILANVSILAAVTRWELASNPSKPSDPVSARQVATGDTFRKGKDISLGNYIIEQRKAAMDMNPIRYWYNDRFLTTKDEIKALPKPRSATINWP